MSGDKQQVRVLDAIFTGATTSYEISGQTGMPIKTVSAYLSVLADSGIIKRVRKNAVRVNGLDKGPASHIYGPATERG